ncbi:MAG: glycosyltransferase family 2 protein [Vicingaceae bacterium]
MAIALILIYALCMLFIFAYSLVQLQLVFHYLKYRKNQKKEEPRAMEKVLENQPFVTIQLPIYNEMYVVERLIDCVAQMDYPKDKLEVQVLDDSDDQTVEIIAQRVAHHKASGLNIVHLRRPKRLGFKAGALAYGLSIAKGELVAVFDADFLPGADFLKRTVGEFGVDRIGMVQTRWEHVNKNYSMLTKLQAFGLDAHFSVEQAGRNQGGHFINFNGTAGIWRKACIEDSGGWQADTLTEDLDLSYRAQLRGWKFKFMEDCGSPAELPAEMNALKTQQYRWTKGAAECSRKNLGKLLRSENFTFKTKVNGVFHLLNSTLFICIVITSLLSVPMLFVKHRYPEYAGVYQLAGFFLFGVLFLAIFYYASYALNGKGLIRSLPSFLIRFPLFLAISMGLSLHNGIAAFEGLIGRKTAFIRTPKFNIKAQGDQWKGNQYLSGKIGKLTFLEIALVFYFIAGIALSYYFSDFGLFPFLLLLVIGYSFVSVQSIRHAMS